MHDFFWGGGYISPQILQIKCSSWGLDLVWTKCQDPMLFFYSINFYFKEQGICEWGSASEITLLYVVLCVCVCGA